MRIRRKVIIDASEGMEGKEEKVRKVTRDEMEVIVTSYGASLGRGGRRGKVAYTVHCLFMHFIILFTPIIDKTVEAVNRIIQWLMRVNRMQKHCKGEDEVTWRAGLAVLHHICSRTLA
jgi:hypothetical protein